MSKQPPPAPTASAVGPCRLLLDSLQNLHLKYSWLVGCFGLNGPLRQYFSLYRVVSQREGEKLVGWLFGFNGPLRQYFSLYRAASEREGKRGEKIVESKNVQTTPPAPTASTVGPCPTIIQIVRRPGTGSLPRTFAPPDHPRGRKKRETTDKRKSPNNPTRTYSKHSRPLPYSNPT